MSFTADDAFAFITDNNGCTVGEYVHHTGLSEKHARRFVKPLIDGGRVVLARKGRGTPGRYYLAGTAPTLEDRLLSLDNVAGGEDFTCRQVASVLGEKSDVIATVIHRLHERGVFRRTETPAGGAIWRLARMNEWLTVPWVNWTPERAGEWAR